MKQYITIGLLTLCLWGSAPLYAQKRVRELNRSGNSYFKKGDFKKAEIDYRKAIEINGEDVVAKYNLANTLYRTNRGQEANKLYDEALKNMNRFSTDQQADLAHNAGNVFMKDKEYEKAIECYKASLRRRSTDEETRYNLALAQKLLEKQKQNGRGNGQNNQNKDKDKQDQQNKDQKKQDQKKQNQQNKDQQKQQDQKKQDQRKEERQQNGRMSKENAEKILKAFLQDEKKTQQEVDQRKQEQQGKTRNRQKNW